MCQILDVQLYIIRMALCPHAMERIKSQFCEQPDVCVSGTARVLTICARRYIWAWLAVKVELDALPSNTACWEIPEGAEFTL